jgi:hypothetical protein
MVSMWLQTHEGDHVVAFSGSASLVIGIAVASAIGVGIMPGLLLNLLDHISF